MKQILLFTLGLIFSVNFVFAGGSQPGNWRWRNDDGTTSAGSGGATWATTGVNMPIILNYDQTSKVFRLRMQMDQGSLPAPTDGQIFLQYFDAGTSYVNGGPITSGSSGSWETNPLTGKPQPIVAFRGQGGSNATNDPGGSGSTDNNTSSSNTANGGSTTSYWNTIPNSNGVMPTMYLSSGNVLASTNLGSSSVFIMAGTSKVIDQQLTAASSGSTYATYATPSSSNDINQLGRPDFLDYTHAYASNTIWAGGVEYSTTNGTSVANRSNTSANSPQIVEFEFALKLNPAYASGLKSVAGHRFFFRIRSHGTETESYTGYSSPEGSGHFAGGSSTGNSPNVGPYTNNYYADTNYYLENTLRTKTFTFGNTTTTYLYDNRWPAYLNDNGNDSSNTTATSNSNPNNGTRYESLPLVLNSGTWSSGNYYTDGAGSSSPSAMTRKSIFDGSVMSNTIALANSNDYRASAPYPYLDIYPFALPVSYKEPLAATVVNNSNVLLTWTTSQEINAKSFAIQRSADGVSFTTINTVASKAANGNSAVAIDYTYTDMTPLSGANYYRLNQIDQDSKSELSNVVSVNLSTDGFTASKLFPNPASSNITISNIQVGTTYKIVSASGQVVGSGMATSNNQVIAVNQLAAGLYFVQFRSSFQGDKVLKFIKK